MAFPGQVVIVEMNHNPACVLNQYDGVPFITPVREPVGTCASTAWHTRGRGRHTTADRNLIHYTEYLDNILANAENLYVVRFTDLINDVSAVIDGLVKRYPQLSKLNRMPTSNQIVIRMVNQNKNRYNIDWVTQGHIPRPVPTNNEGPFLELLSSDSRELLTKAQESYWKVLEQSYLQ